MNKNKSKMLCELKTDGILLHYKFNGKMMDYLTKLSFTNARIIFMFRSRMFTTKGNFKSNWEDVTCWHCGQLDTGEHLFNCSGYSDLVTAEVNYEMYFTLDVNIRHRYTK